MKTHKANYWIFTLDKRPAMTHTLMASFTGTYQDAVALCHKIYHKTGRSTYVASAKSANYYWHRVDGYGVATDRNLNSGIPETQNI